MFKQNQNQDTELMRRPSRDGAAAQIVVIDVRGVKSADKGTWPVTMPDI
jgi:hypothetical protein